MKSWEVIDGREDGRVVVVFSVEGRAIFEAIKAGYVLWEMDVRLVFVMKIDRLGFEDGLAFLWGGD